MAKARSRTAVRKVKDRWRAKNWYQILAPTLFDNVPVAETLADAPHNLMGRITEVSMQDLTNDFRKSHIKLYFKVDKVQESNAYTHFEGHTLTSDYLRRMIRRRKSRIDGVYDAETKDGAYIRVKPFAITEKRIQNSQKKLIRDVMKETVLKEGKAKTLNEFIIDTLDGKIGSEIYKNCKNIYPVKRIEVYKTEIIRLPTVVVEEKKPSKKEEAKEVEKKEPPKKEKKKKEEKKTEVKEKEIKEEKKEEKKTKTVKKEVKKVKKPAKKKKAKPKAKPKSTTKAKKVTKKKTATSKKKASK
jgi:small subunit ribosomal protein S3Ae